MLLPPEDAFLAVRSFLPSNGDHERAELLAASQTVPDDERVAPARTARAASAVSTAMIGETCGNGTGTSMNPVCSGIVPVAHDQLVLLRVEGYCDNLIVAGEFLQERFAFTACRRGRCHMTEPRFEIENESYLQRP